MTPTHVKTSRHRMLVVGMMIFMVSRDKMSVVASSSNILTILVVTNIEVRGYIPSYPGTVSMIHCKCCDTSTYHSEVGSEN